MDSEQYIVATLRPWNHQVFQERIRHFPGHWRCIQNPTELTPTLIRTVQPRYVFFPHWSHVVPEEIFTQTTCVCFHETDLPFGRGGSPLQNLIERGHHSTMISALKMVAELDAGPVYLKRPLSLEGLAEDIFLRAAHCVADMMLEIVTTNPQPIPQNGDPTVFRRRKPEQSAIPSSINDLRSLFDHIRMLDAEGYPKAFFDFGPFRCEITRPAIKTNEILADIRIRLREESLNAAT